MSDEAKSRRFKPAAERRHDILGAATSLFRERGFDSTSVQDIAAAAGVAAGTVYLYFSSKEDVLRQIHRGFFDGLEARYAEIARATIGQGNTHEKVIDALIDGLVDYIEEDRGTAEVICRFVPRASQEIEETEKSFDALMAETFRVGMEGGGIHVSDPEMTARILTRTMGVTLASIVEHPDPEDTSRLIAATKELFRKTLAPIPEGANR